jgi:hypothetical protein
MKDHRDMFCRIGDGKVESYEMNCNGMKFGNSLHNHYSFDLSNNANRKLLLVNLISPWHIIDIKLLIFMLLAYLCNFGTEIVGSIWAYGRRSNRGVEKTT